MLLMLAASGTWQIWHLHHADKMGTYKPPWLLQLISTAHTAADVGVGGLHPADAYRWLMCLVAVMLATSAALGLVMAWRVAGGRTVALLLFRF